MPGFEKKGKPKIFVVDDDFALLEIIKASQLMKGYEIHTFPSGEKCLEASEVQNPELFLLDYSMPGMDGIELCVRLKKKDVHKKVPVLFLTGMNDTDSIRKAFNVGAVDYLSKPVVLEEVAIRVKNHIDLFRAVKKIELYAQDMEKLAAQRAKQLVHADRLATLGTMSAGLAHEIKNPTTFISGNAQTIEDFWEILEPVAKLAIENSDSNAEKLSFIVEEMSAVVDGIKTGVKRIVKVVDSLKAFSRKESAEKIPFNLLDSLETALVLCKRVMNNHVVVDKKILDPSLCILGDSQQIEQVLINLFVNATDAMEGQKDAKIIIDVREVNGVITLIVYDNGPGISEKTFEKLWEPFFTTKEAGKGTGLGLPIVRSIIEGHNGQIDARNRVEGGLEFIIQLPACANGD